MHDLRRGLRPAWGACALLACSGLVGCGFDLGAGGDPSSLPSTILGTDPGDIISENGDNDLFEAAERHVLGGATMLLSGEVEGPRDVDVFDLGPVSAGDRVIVDMTPDEDLHSAIAIFDDQRNSLLVNDHRNAYLGRMGPYIDVFFHRASSSCYVAVSATPGFNASGSYSLVARKESGAPMPGLHPEVVLLDFVGGKNVTIGGRTAINVPPFDAAGIDESYRDATDKLTELVVRYVREDFAGFDVTIRTTSEGDVPKEGVTRLFFGTFDEALLGVAEGVDEFNYVSGQEAIVFTDTFAAFMVIKPTVDEMARALANVASHEIGHLLGLVHTGDPIDLMDVTATLSQLTLDQDFARAPIYADVFPMGRQDSAQCLLDAVGGDAQAVFAKQSATRSKLRPAQRDVAGESARGEWHMSTCSLTCGVE